MKKQTKNLWNLLGLYRVKKLQEIIINKGEYRLMRLGKYLSGLTKPELEILQENLNLTDDELEVFKGLVKGRSKVRIAEDCLVSVGTVANRIRAIQDKVNRL